MRTRVDHDVRRAAGTAPVARDHLLPAAPAMPLVRDSLFDTFGHAMATSPLGVLAGAIAGGVGAAFGIGHLTGAGRVAGGLGGVVGGITGAAVAALGIGATGRHRHDPPPPARGAPAQPAVASPEPVRVMTWNIHGSMGGPNSFFSSDREIALMEQTIRAQRPDVVMLQEVDLDAPRSNRRNGLQELASRLHPTSAVSYSPWTTVTGRTQHVAVMTFGDFRVTDARGFMHDDPHGTGSMRRLQGALSDVTGAIRKLVGIKSGAGSKSVSRFESRGTIDTFVRTPKGNDVRVMAAHYAGPNAQINYQDQWLPAMAPVIAAWKGPTLLGADFNVRSGTKWGAVERDVLGQAGLRDSFSAVGIKPGDAARNSTPGGVDIDRIYASGQFQVLDTRVIQVPKDSSDHLAVIADMQIQPASR